MTSAADAEKHAEERRERDKNDRRIIGHVVQCDGSRATIAALADDAVDSTSTHWTVGKLISINLRASRIVGLVYEIGRREFIWSVDGENPIEIKVELIGEVRDGAAGSKPVFDRGITTYPPIGSIAHRIRARDLASVYELAGRRTINIGQLTQDQAVEASIAVDDLLARHFAVVGTTGVGKSTAVSLILRRTIEARPDLRVLVLDPHNEFGNALAKHAVRINATTLELPFWLFRLEEFCEVIFRGREVVPEELDLLRDLIPAAKHIYRAGPGGAVFRRASDALTADTPIPYRLLDLLKLLDERIGMLDSKHDRPSLRALKVRLESAIGDPDFRFMFHSRAVEDSIQGTIGKIFRIPHEGRPITCFEMAGMASEVVNAVCSVLARLAFDVAMWSEGRFRLLVLCEEAHRYLPSDPKLGFAPTRQSLSRIAKEGRKYGCSLGVVTQRPGELDPTVLSQCSTVFAMRLANEQDQAIIRSAIADSSASTLTFLSTVGQREAIAFGEAVAATMRLRFEQVMPGELPGVVSALADIGAVVDAADLELIAQKLRQVSRTSGDAAGPPREELGAHRNAASGATLAPSLPVAAPTAPPRQQPAPDLDFDPGYGLPRGGGAFGQRPRG